MEITTVKSDSKFKAKCRSLQNNYRLNVLKESEMGFGPYPNSKDQYGNMLVNGENSGNNFISDATFEYAKQRVRDKQVNRFLTIDEYRLFNNMLSSMPMCFNLFADLRKHLLSDEAVVSTIVKSLFKEIPWIENVQYIEVEYIPIPIEAYTNDKSAFDAIIITTDKKGKKGILGIETKYTDLFGSNSSSNTELKDRIIEDHKIFNEDYEKKLLAKGYQQVDRNYLLTYTYTWKNKIKYFANVVISPEQDQRTAEEIKELQDALNKNKNSILKISLEEFVERGRKCKALDISALMDKFHKRYLNW